VLRRATIDDAEALAALGPQTFIETFVEGFGVPYPADDLRAYLESAYSLEATRARLADTTQAWWTAERSGEIVAFANTGPMSLPHPEGRPTHAELRRLYVTRRAQGQGLGTRLLEEALAWMEAHGDGPLWVGVWSGNRRAQRLYEAYGFRKAGEYKYPVGSWYDDELILRRG
jgi:ribosomal protein S18 acetylase RimI-like enzyme